MRRDRESDFQTLRLFVILGALTLALVWGIKMVLFAPAVKPAAPEIRADKSIFSVTQFLDQERRN